MSNITQDAFTSANASSSVTTPSAMASSVDIEAFFQELGSHAASLLNEYLLLQHCTYACLSDIQAYLVRVNPILIRHCNALAHFRLHDCVEMHDFRYIFSRLMHHLVNESSLTLLNGTAVWAVPFNPQTEYAPMSRPLGHLIQMRADLPTPLSDPAPPLPSLAPPLKAFPEREPALPPMPNSAVIKMCNLLGFTFPGYVPPLFPPLSSKRL
ncbi:hypothetical protein C8J56DRAFT_1049687 [Mycena floridula]|nr:hypothetical protein C8J56DRAFT_1049687 [Mycena floridula]